MEWKDITRIVLGLAIGLVCAVDWYRSRHVRPGTTNEELKEDILELKVWIYITLLATIITKIGFIITTI